MKTILSCMVFCLLVVGVWYGMVMSVEKGWCECMGNHPGINTEFKWFGGCQFESDVLFVPYEENNGIY